MPLMPPAFRQNQNHSNQFQGFHEPSIGEGAGYAPPHPAEAPIAHMIGTNSSLGPRTSWLSAHLNQGGRFPGLSRMNRQSTINFDSPEPPHSPQSDIGARFIVGDRQ